MKAKPGECPVDVLRFRELPGGKGVAMDVAGRVTVEFSPDEWRGVQAHVASLRLPEPQPQKQEKP